jgi:hypothetical protein
LKIIITAYYVRLRKKGKGWVKEKVKDGQSLHPDTLEAKERVLRVRSRKKGKG